MAQSRSGLAGRIEAATNLTDAELSEVRLTFADGTTATLPGTGEGAGESTAAGESADAKPADFADWSYNDLVSALAAADAWEKGADKERACELAAEAGIARKGEAEAADSDDSGPETVDEWVDAVEAGDADAREARDALGKGDAKTLMRRLNGGCKSEKGCGYGARTKGADFCLGCHKQNKAPDAKAFDITEEQAGAVPALFEAGEYDTRSDVVSALFA